MNKLKPIIFYDMKKTDQTAKPFLKWAGGKTQLLEQIRQNLPENLYKREFTYIEPFVGSGAMLFWMLRLFPNIEKAVICDANHDLIQVWRIIATHPIALIDVLTDMQNEYHSLENNGEQKKIYYYKKRDEFNARNADDVMQSALFVFLNRTCFNGLYRVNRKNSYNVPMGNYKKPTICDAENIMAVNQVLARTEIICSDFEQTLEYASERSFFYLDPPYKPLNSTSNFTAYTKTEFDDSEQIRLSNFCRKLDECDHKWLLSNSDHEFFDGIYSDFYKQKVKAKRIINSKPEKRGELNEILIRNF